MLSNYFKEHKSLHRLLVLLKDKYVSLGRYSGSVKLPHISSEEAKDLTDLFGKLYVEGQDVTIRFKDIEKVASNTKFENFSWEELFTNYFGETIIDKKTQLMNNNREEEQFFDSVLTQLSEEERIFTKQILDEKNIRMILSKRYKKEKGSFFHDFYYIIKLLFQIDQMNPTTLAVFASLTGNPHFLDFKTSNMNLFLKLLAYKLDIEEPNTTIETIRLLESVGISVDTVSNFVITYKLKSDSLLVQSFYNEKEILNLNLSNMNKIQNLDTDEKIVFVFENPSLLSELKVVDIPIVITSGNANLCVFKVLELLAKSGNSIYYNGDFDPEGLLNAQKLKQIIPTIQFFCYDHTDFEVTKSQEVISEARLHKLNNVNLKELQPIKNDLLKYKRAGYQENNIDNISTYMQRFKKDK